MGREIRMVPPNWEHPRHTADDARRPEKIGEYRSCYDTDYETAAKEWCENFQKWANGPHPSQPCNYTKYYWEWEHPPDEELCRPAFGAEATWYQLYETVSEGTPVSPPFATAHELAVYLSENGDFWFQKDEREGRSSFRTKPTLEQAASLVGAGYAPSFVVVHTNSGTKILDPHEMFDE